MKKILIIDEQNHDIEEALNILRCHEVKEIDIGENEGCYSELLDLFLEDEISQRIDVVFKFRDDYNSKLKEKYIDKVLEIIDMDQYLDSSFLDELIGDSIDMVNEENN